MAGTGFVEWLVKKGIEHKEGFLGAFAVHPKGVHQKRRLAS
jgi:hypothetical protein